jgi:hypothetical protein
MMCVRGGKDAEKQAKEMKNPVLDIAEVWSQVAQDVSWVEMVGTARG